jgi:hypothetical protein
MGLFLTIVGTGRYLPASFYIATLATLTYFIAVIISRWHAPRHTHGATPQQLTQEQLARRNHHQKIIRK